MTVDSSYSLEALDRRWQLEKTPQVGLRLAEEYRRKGDLSASIEVLAAGLEAYPTHTASRVALSRYLVDGERFEEAVPHLEQIITRDPTHLVANKLLVGAYVGVGRLGDARDKLDIYEMMGEGDADIEGLQALLGAAERSGLTPIAIPEAAEPPPGAEAFTESATVIGPEFEATEIPDQAADLAVEEPFAQSVAEEPFGSVWTADESSDYWREVADEGIFAFGPSEISGDDEETRLAEPVEPVEPAELAETVEPEALEALEAPSAPSAPSADAATDSTVTLGQLYLEQGHRREAVEVFKEVLTREPENEAAQRGLKITVDPAAAASGDTGSEEEALMAGVLERKKSALTAYLAQIRRSVTAGV